MSIITGRPMRVKGEEGVRGRPASSRMRAASSCREPESAAWERRTACRAASRPAARRSSSPCGAAPAGASCRAARSSSWHSPARRRASSGLDGELLGLTRADGLFYLFLQLGVAGQQLQLALQVAPEALAGTHPAMFTPPALRAEACVPAFSASSAQAERSSSSTPRTDSRGAVSLRMLPSSSWRFIHM